MSTEEPDLTMKDTGEFFILQLNTPVAADFLHYWIRKGQERGYDQWEMPQKLGEFRFSRRKDVKRE